MYRNLLNKTVFQSNLILAPVRLGKNIILVKMVSGYCQRQVFEMYEYLKLTQF